MAWAAGLYEGEGSCSAYLPKGRKTYRRQMAVSQGGDPGKPPLVLLGFRSAVVGAGNITGPYRDYLFYWKTTQIRVIENIATSLWQFLSQEKRDQYLRASQMIGRPSSLELATPRSESVETESAWPRDSSTAKGRQVSRAVATEDLDTASRRWRSRNRAIGGSQIRSFGSNSRSGPVRSQAHIHRGTLGLAFRAIAGNSEATGRWRPSPESFGRGSEASSGCRSSGLSRLSMQVWFAAPTRVRRTETLSA